MNKVYLLLAFLISSLEISAISNIISGNVLDGVLVVNASNDNIITDNAIGTDRSGTLNLGNGGNGVEIIVNSADNTVGGVTLAAGNLIAFNQKGVVVGDSVSDTGSVGNTILNNSIYNNKLIGIDLANDGSTPNHATNPTPGPNNFQNYPVLSTPVVTSTGLNVGWSLHSRVSSSFILQFFRNNPGDPEGKILIQQLTVTTDANGNASGTISIGGVPLNSAITATATYLAGGVTGVASDTSEFGSVIYGVVNPCPAKPCTK